MKAAVLERLAGPEGLTVVERPAPDEGGGVVVDVHAAGVSFPDLLMSQGKYQIQPELPFVLGVEGAGVVAEAPASAGLRMGQRVVFSALGSWAEQVAVAPEQVLPLPDALTMEQGAGLLMNYHTAHFGLIRRGRLQPSETLLVHGAAGGVGSAAIQVGKAVGARVIAVVSDQRKAEVASRLGADECVLAGEGWLERVRRASAGGVNVIFDPVAGDRFDDSIRALAPEGRLLIIGFAGGSIPRVAVNRVLFRNIDMVGAGWGAFLEVHPEVKESTHTGLLSMVEEGFVAPFVGAEFPLERAAEALQLIADRRALGKVVLTVKEGAS
ncbi:MAG TPA: NADPH:quinone oxidoreductase family protein [Candidatus Dormibacteraeota bacterium]|nr:NADPH:quinone oxidoreductase family protein [Candidatus Dormibacteraeota bacterium]